MNKTAFIKSLREALKSRKPRSYNALLEETKKGLLSPENRAKIINAIKKSRMK